MVEDEPDPPASRRQVLRLGGVAIAALAGCPGREDSDPKPCKSAIPGTTATESTLTKQIPEAYGDRFDSIIDVTDAGADPTGSQYIDDVVESAADEDTLLVFPDGTYRIDSLSIPAPDNFGLVAPQNAASSLLPPEGRPDIDWFQFTEASDFLYDGINFDFREIGPVGGTVLSGPGNIVFRNCRVYGKYDTVDQQLMRIDVTDDGGEALVENFVAAGINKRGVNTTGLYVGREHAGEITFRNCRLKGFSDNALYASPPGGEGGSYDAENGKVHVRGGVFRNNNIAAIRIGSTGSTVKNATVIVDEVPNHMDSDALNARGIRLRGKQDQLVENCRIAYESGAGETSGALTINGANGHATIRNVYFEMNSGDTPAIFAKSPERGGNIAPTFQDVTIAGTGLGGQTVTIVDRPGTTFSGCCIDQSGSRRDGIQFIGSANCLVQNSQIEVPGDPIILEDSSLSDRDIDSSICDYKC